MPLRRSSVLARGIAAAGIVLAVASCSNITPLGPTEGPVPTPVAVRRAAPVGVVYQLASPIILQVMRSQPPAGTGGCPVGLVQVVLPPGAPPMPCFQPVGTLVTIAVAAVSPVSFYPAAPQQGQSAQPASYRFMIGVQPAQVAAVTALITQAYDSRAALGITVDGKLWQAAQVLQAFPGQLLQITLMSKSQALQLRSLLVYG